MHIDKFIERRGAGAIKTDVLKEKFGRCRVVTCNSPYTGTFLSQQGNNRDALVDLFINKAHLALNDGETFNPGEKATGYGKS